MMSGAHLLYMSYLRLSLRDLVGVGGALVVSVPLQGAHINNLILPHPTNLQGLLQEVQWNEPLEGELQTSSPRPRALL